MTTSSKLLRLIGFIVGRKTFINFILVLSSISCSQNVGGENLYKERILYEKKDQKGRILQSVITGRIEGEDIFLTIVKFDSLGRAINEYGAKPYGNKFKSITKYDNGDRVIEELIYNYPPLDQFENYESSDNPYSLSDTLADFESFESKTRIVYEYLDRKGLIRERSYLIEYDSMKRELLRLLSDTTYRSKKEEE